MTTTATVSVACKLPSGITITHAPRDAKGETVGAAKTVTFAGANQPGAVLGFGITHDVDAEWFKNWIETDGKNFPPVRNLAIFAQDTSAKAKSAAKEMAKDVKTGLEGLDPAKPAPGVEPVSTDKE